MTGKHACRHQAYYNGMEMDDGETLPGVLSDNGYYTIQVGKTHFFPKRRHAGFDKLILPEDYAADMRRKYGKEKLYKIPENEPWDEMVVRDSRSFLPALKGKELPTDRAIFSESGIHGHAFMVKYGTQKYNFYPQTNEFDHFDLSADPSELNNLGDEVTWENLPSWARKIFEKILHSTEPMRQFGYGSTDGRILPMFT